MPRLASRGSSAAWHTFQPACRWSGRSLVALGCNVHAQRGMRCTPPSLPMVQVWVGRIPKLETLLVENKVEVRGPAALLCTLPALPAAGGRPGVRSSSRPAPHPCTGALHGRAPPDPLSAPSPAPAPLPRRPLPSSRPPSCTLRAGRTQWQTSRTCRYGTWRWKGWLHALPPGPLIMGEGSAFFRPQAASGSPMGAVGQCAFTPLEHSHTP